MLSLITMFRLDQFLSAKKDLDYPSLKHYRNAASHRRTFDDMILMVIRVISDRFKGVNLEKIVSISSSEEEDEEEENATAKTKPRTRARSLLFEDRSSWLRSMERSPTRNVRNFYESVDQSSSLYNRRIECAGSPIYRVNVVKNQIITKGKGCRNRCALCTLVTNFWCSNCHVWLCGPHIGRKDEETGNNKLISFKDCNIYGLNTCWINWHEPGLHMMHEKDHS